MNRATIIKGKQQPPKASIAQTVEQRRQAMTAPAGEEQRPTRKDALILELIMTTFGAPNVLKAIAQISRQPEVTRFADEFPKIKQNDGRLEVCGYYREFLESLLSACGALRTLQTLLKGCSNRVYLNQKQEKTKAFVGTWLATKRVIHMTIAAMQPDASAGEDLDADLKELARAIEQAPSGKARLETFIDRSGKGEAR